MICFAMIPLGLVFIILGTALGKGHTNLLHSYHRHHVSEDDLPVLGKLTGLGMILIGLGIAVFGILFDATLLNNTRRFLTVGIGILIAGLATGLGIMLYAVITYNKGLF